MVLDDDGDEILTVILQGGGAFPRGTEEEEEEEEEEREEEEREDRKRKSLPFLKPLLGVFLIVDFSEERVREGRRDDAKGADMGWFFLRGGGVK